ncbi:hypothetical protein CC79DRAFT_1338232 [Sarocladium strictum]
MSYEPWAITSASAVIAVWSGADKLKRAIAWSGQIQFWGRVLWGTFDAPSPDTIAPGWRISRSRNNTKLFP